MIPERYTPITYALFRIVFGFLFLCFGLQKMFGLFGGQVAAAGQRCKARPVSSRLSAVC